MPADAHRPPGQIGPNAILQLVEVLDARIGEPGRRAFWRRAELAEPPDGDRMVDERPVAQLHQALRQEFPTMAPALAAEAGRRTGDYILAHRIPAMAQRVLRALPAWLAARALTRAIGQHAWTFTGSGAFRVVSQRPLIFEIAGNPVISGERADRPLCTWHTQVFERLFRELVAENYRVRETHCAAAGHTTCRFALERAPRLERGAAPRPGV